MTVDELIALLQDHDPDAPVIIDRMGVVGRRGGSPVTLVNTHIRGGDQEAVVISLSPREMLRGPVRPLAPEVIAERKAAAKARRNNERNTR